MDSTDPNSKTNLLTRTQAAHRLAVSVNRLLELEKQQLLKPTVTLTGERLYSTEQLDNFVKNKNLNNDLQNPTSSVNKDVQTTQHVSKSDGNFYHKSVKWLGRGRYSEKYIKDYLVSQIRDSLTFNVKRPSKKTISIASGAIFVIALGLISQQSKLQSFLKNNNDATRQDNKAVLGASTSRLKLAGNVIFAVPITAKEDVTLSKNLLVLGQGVFKGNITAPNIIYSIKAGDHITVSPGQTPTIGVDLSGIVTSFQGKSGDIKLQAGTDISIDGFTISDTSTLTTVAARGACPSCITDGDVANGLTIDASGNIAGEAIKSGIVGTTVGGTGITTYATGDLIYASATDTLASLPIGSIGQFMTVGNTGLPTWDNIGSFAVAVIKKDDVVISSPTDTLNFSSGDFNPTVGPSGQVNFTLATTLSSITSNSGNR